MQSSMVAGKGKTCALQVCPNPIRQYLVVWYLNKQGGTRNLSLLLECKRVMSWSKRFLSDHMEGFVNILADNQKILRPTEWELGNRYFQQIVHRRGLPELDLMATKDNPKLQRFCSPLWQ